MMKKFIEVTLDTRLENGKKLLIAVDAIEAFGDKEIVTTNRTYTVKESKGKIASMIGIQGRWKVVEKEGSKEEA